jgi:hypothetical protein
MGIVEYRTLKINLGTWEIKKLKSTNRYADIKVINTRFLCFEYERKWSGLENLLPPEVPEEGSYNTVTHD